MRKTGVNQKKIFRAGIWQGIINQRYPAAIKLVELTKFLSDKEDLSDNTILVKNKRRIKWKIKPLF